MARRETFTKGRDLLGLDVEYEPSVSIEQLPALMGSNKCDLLVNAGILYHVFDALQSLTTCRELLKTGGLLVFETFYLFDERRPVLLFNPCDDRRRGNPHANTFWRGGKTAIEGMLEVAGFSVLSSISVNGRIALVAQASKPGDIKSRFSKIQKIHKTYMAYENYGERVDYRELEQNEATSSITYAGPNTHRFVFSSLYKSGMPLQPEWKPSGVTKAKALLKDLKFWLGTRYARL